MSNVIDPAGDFFREHLRSWFAANGRVFPWRTWRDPYRVLIAERMLHRTRADQVVPVYERFLARYPTVQSLAIAEEAEVRGLLASLGLGWRFETFVPMARRVVDVHHGRIPMTHEELLALPGVGAYTATAILCFAFDQPVAVVDTNTIRTAGRYLTGTSWVADDRKKRHVQAAVARLLDHRHPALANYAILDLGALICTSRSPLCSRCPVAERCVYHSSHRATYPASIAAPADLATRPQRQS